MAILLGWFLIVLSLVAAVWLVIAGWDDFDHAALIGWGVGIAFSGLMIGVVLFLLADIRDATMFLAWREELRANPPSEDTGESPLAERVPPATLSSDEPGQN
jgi:hypothetical protein